MKHKYKACYEKHCEWRKPLNKDTGLCLFGKCFKQELKSDIVIVTDKPIDMELFAKKLLETLNEQD